MKRNLLLLVVCLSCNIILAQDIIVKKNGEEIKSKVIEITPDAIKYKEYDFQDGPLKSIYSSDAAMIIYEDGRREIIESKAPPASHSQTNTPPPPTVTDDGIKVFGMGFGIAFGGFSPGDVNEYIESQYEDVTEFFGSYSIYMCEEFAVVMTFRPSRMFRFNVAFEAGIAPKIVSVSYYTSYGSSSSTDFYNFGRYGASIEGYLNLPLGSGRKANMLFGAGTAFHYMYFQDYKATKLGLRVTPLGWSFKFGGFQPQVLLGADLFAKGVDDSSFELNYTRGFLKINLCF